MSPLTRAGPRPPRDRSCPAPAGTLSRTALRAGCVGFVLILDFAGADVRHENLSLPAFAQVRGLTDRLEMVVRGRVEPPTFRFSGGRSYQLSYLTWPGDPVTLLAPDPSGPDGI